MDDMIAEAITDQFGSRCDEYVPGCPCCDAWKQYDDLVYKAQRFDWMKHFAGKWSVTPDPGTWTSQSGVRYKPLVTFASHGVSYSGQPFEAALDLAMVDNNPWPDIFQSLK